VAGRIRASDIDEVKSRTNIADVVGEHVSLKSAGVGSLKGLCPFHDERSPSFHVRPASGYYHCFGCGESGDVYSFMQKLDHVSFTEAVERLADRLGYALTYEEGASKSSDGPNRARLFAANDAAAKFFQAQLATADAAIARTFLGGRGFDKEAAAHFGVGYAPKTWGEMRTALKAQGFTDDEMVTAGLLSQGDKGPYDRFRGRVIWPIRDVTGQTVGFGARKLFDDDQGPKYLNTPDTPIYHKAQVLYGLDLAKRDISKTRQVVVVEGYTDVMAAHLSGVTTAIATCGTAFGVDHIKLIRRIMGDDSGLGEVVFTFDPDAAGQKAAMRAFSEQQRFNAATYVAVAPEGLDPCDLRLERGENAVRELINHKVPMFEFVMKTLVSQYNLDSVEGRVAALREAAPVVAEIRDGSLRPGYTRELARITGVDLTEAQRAVERSARAGKPSSDTAQHDSDQFQPPNGGFSGDGAAPVVSYLELGRDPVVRLERDALSAYLQYPRFVPEALRSTMTQVVLGQPSLEALRQAIVAASVSADTDQWLPSVLSSVPEQLAPLVTQLAVAPLPESDGERLPLYVASIVSSVIERDLLRRKADAMSRLQRLGGDDPMQAREIQQLLVALENERRALRDN
jgi:DNA primase